MSSDTQTTLLVNETNEKEVQLGDKKENIDTNGNFKSVNKYAGKNGRGPRRMRAANDDRRMAWEAEQANKVIIEKDVKGKVKWYSVRYHYGFIARDDEKDNDVFVHQTAIMKSRIVKYYLRTLGDGEEVIFDIVQGKQGPEAANVTGPNGTEVRGSRFHNLQFLSFRRRFGYNRDRNSQEREKFSDKVASQDNLGEEGKRCHPPQSERKSLSEKTNTAVDDTKKVNTERKRHVRNFRAHRHPNAAKKIGSDENEEGAGDSKKENLASEVDNDGQHSEGRGDGRRLKGKRDKQHRRSNATTDASRSNETQATAKEEETEEEQPAVVVGAEKLAAIEQM